MYVRRRCHDVSVTDAAVRQRALRNAAGAFVSMEQCIIFELGLLVAELR